jgi:hypothetical protein
MVERSRVLGWLDGGSRILCWECGDGGEGGIEAAVGIGWMVDATTVLVVADA